MIARVPIVPSIVSKTKILLLVVLVLLVVAPSFAWIASFVRPFASTFPFGFSLGLVAGTAGMKSLGGRVSP